MVITPEQIFNLIPLFIIFVLVLSVLLARMNSYEYKSKKLSKKLSANSEIMESVQELVDEQTQ